MIRTHVKTMFEMAVNLNVLISSGKVERQGERCGACYCFLEGEEK